MVGELLQEQYPQVYPLGFVCYPLSEPKPEIEDASFRDRNASALEQCIGDKYDWTEWIGNDINIDDDVGKDKLTVLRKLNIYLRNQNCNQAHNPWMISGKPEVVEA